MHNLECSPDDTASSENRSVAYSEFVVIVDARHCQAMRKALTSAGLLVDTNRRQRHQSTVIRLSQTSVAIPLVQTKDNLDLGLLNSILSEFPGAQVETNLGQLLSQHDRKDVKKTPEDKLIRLRSAVGQLELGEGFISNKLIQDLPASYELFDGLLLLPNNCLRSLEFASVREPVLDLLENIFRQVNLFLIISYCMYSRLFFESVLYEYLFISELWIRKIFFEFGSRDICRIRILKLIF
jgi:hypothetical protein